MLAKWKIRADLDATYEALLKALLKGGENKAAKALCQLIAEGGE